MKFSARQYAEALFDSLNDTDPKDQEIVLDNFVRILADNGNLREFPEIASEFEKLSLQAKGIKPVTVTSAHPISPGNEKVILESLNKIIKSKVKLNKEIDENLIGGAVIEIDDTIIDGSVKNSLEQLKTRLIE